MVKQQSNGGKENIIGKHINAEDALDSIILSILEKSNKAIHKKQQLDPCLIRFMLEEFIQIKYMAKDPIKNIN